MAYTLSGERSNLNLIRPVRTVTTLISPPGLPRMDGSEPSFNFF
jgi:hypothetical protein